MGRARKSLPPPRSTFSALAGRFCLFRRIFRPGVGSVGEALLSALSLRPRTFAQGQALLLILSALSETRPFSTSQPARLCGLHRLGLRREHHAGRRGNTRMTISSLTTASTSILYYCCSTRAERTGYGSSGYSSGHPESPHWTPGRGLHTHGHLHVPHRATPTSGPTDRPATPRGPAINGRASPFPATRAGARRRRSPEAAPRRGGRARSAARRAARPGPAPPRPPPAAPATRRSPGP